MKKKIENTENRHEIAKSPQSNQDELAALDHMIERRQSFNNISFEDGRPVGKGGEPLVHALVMLAATLKTGDAGVAVQTVYNAAAGQFWLAGDLDSGLRASLAQIVDFDPQTPIEATLISQMVAVNSAIGTCMQTAMNPEQCAEGRQRNLCNATKLQRTFLLQIEALQKLKGKGHQTVRVEHVTVNAGGQAIVGNIERAGGGGQ